MFWSLLGINICGKKMKEAELYIERNGVKLAVGLTASAKHTESFRTFVTFKN